MPDFEVSFPTVLHTYSHPGAVVPFDQFQPGQLVSITLEPPGFERLGLLVTNRPHSALYGPLTGLLQEGTQVNTENNLRLRRDGFDVPLQNEAASILGSCDNGSFQTAFYGAMNAGHLVIRQCLLWMVAKPHPYYSEASFMISQARIKEIQIRAKEPVTAPAPA